MSHNVTITRTVTSSHTTSTLIVNTGYLKTVPGLLKLAQLVHQNGLILFCHCILFILPPLFADHRCRLRWHGGLVLCPIQLSASGAPVLPADVHQLSDRHLLSARLVPVLAEYGWHYFEDHLRTDLSFGGRCAAVFRFRCVTHPDE